MSELAHSCPDNTSQQEKPTTWSVFGEEDSRVRILKTNNGCEQHNWFVAPFLAGSEVLTWTSRKLKRVKFDGSRFHGMQHVADELCCTLSSCLPALKKLYHQFPKAKLDEEVEFQAVEVRSCNSKL